MTQPNRRNVLQAFAWSVALSALGMPVGLSASGRSVSFPTRPILLKRVLERGLGGGASLVVTREWECRFLGRGRGARIEARQVDVGVRAPAALAALAEVERRREVTGLFPMTLDPAGAIVGWPEGEASVKLAVARAARLIEESAAAPAEANDAQRRLAEIGKTAASLVSQVPRDLFFPRTGSRTERRKLNLAGGLEGTYEVTISATARNGSGLLQRSERRIVTRIGDSARVSRESWSIA